MALVTVQRSPSPSGSAETEEQDAVDADDSNLKSPRQRRRRSKSALKKLRKLFNTVRFVSKLKPCFSESYFTVKGAALILPQSDYEGTYARKPSKSQGDIQNHLQSMFSLLRPQDTIKVAVKLEGSHTRYLAVVSCIGRQDTEESVILGVNLREKPEIGLILPIWAHTKIELDGDGGFSIKLDTYVHIFKPVSVQAMWSALQSLNKVVKTATDNLYIPRGLTHTWMGFYEAKLSKDASIIAEWNTLTDVDCSYRMKSKIDKDSGDEEDFYRQLQTELKLVMMTVDLEEVTSRMVREILEKKLDMDLRKYRGIIDLQMFEIMGQMDAPTLILDYLYLGSEWNASNLEELQQNGVHHILNISREIDNFYTGILHYMNIREWDVEQTNLLKYWEDTHKFINKSRKRGSKTLVHCKMGISRSASTVIAYLMKENKWSLQEAYDFTKAKRNIINPNTGFRKQLETYEGILNASWNRESFEKKDRLSNTSKGLDDVTEVPEVFTAEDMLALNLGKELPDSSDLPFLHTEQDIEIGSRSADSTEESLPDQLSPGTTSDAVITRKKKFPRLDSNVAESGDYISSDSSDDTDSESLLSDSEEKIFQPIDIPGINIEENEKGRRVVKPKGRRAKSESDKTMLVVEEMSGQGHSREGSVSKFKADESWIKPEQEEGVENKLDEPEQDMEKDSQENVVDIDKNDTDKKIGVKIGDVLVVESEEKTEIKNISDNAAVETKTVQDEHGTETDKPREGNQEESLSTENAMVSHEDVKGIEPYDVKGIEPYVKENIPWNLGTVRKQKQDLEEKLGTVAQRKSDPLPEKDLSNKTEEPEIAEITITADETNEQSLIKDTDESVTQAESVDAEHIEVNENTTCIKGADGDTCPPETQKSRRSVYDLEEIDLPEGIVKKTKMEIEDRNRSLEAESPGKRLQRSSSLKTARVTPKAKNRDNERRKTCIAILSPTYTRSDSNQSSGSQSAGRDDDQASHDTDNDTAESTNLGQSEASSKLQASVDEDEDVKHQTGTVKIYKFLGEELTVQEGMVRKQTLDIEHKAKETVIHQALLKAEKQQTEHNSSNTIIHSEETATTKQVSTSSPVNESSKAALSDDVTNSDIPAESTVESLVNVEKNIVDDSLSTVENIKHILYDRGKKGADSVSDDQMGKTPVPYTPVSQRSRTETRPESCFDPETLQLIREIGSALMNSPAKSELDESVGDIQEGASLVSHYVKKIEKNTKVHKKQVKREIVIIEKDGGEQTGQHSNIPSVQLTEQHQQQKSICDSNEIKSEPSRGSPVARRNTFPLYTQTDQSPKSNGKIASLKWSPIAKKDTCDTNVHTHDKELDKSHHDNLRTAAATANTDDELVLNNTSQATNNKNADLAEAQETEACSVKSLVGKFLAKSSSSTTAITFPDPLNSTITTETTKADVRVNDSSGKTFGYAKSPPRNDPPVTVQSIRECATTPPKHDPSWVVQGTKTSVGATTPPKHDPSWVGLGTKTFVGATTPPKNEPLWEGQGMKASLGATTPTKHVSSVVGKNTKDLMHATSPPKHDFLVSGKTHKELECGTPPKHDQPLLGHSSKVTSPHKHDRPKLQHRQSEPAISLSEKSLHMFSKTYAGFGNSERDVLTDVPEVQSVELRETNTGRPERPKSVGHTRDSSGASAGNRRAVLRQAKTLSESEEDSQVFSWEGKKLKTKKTYGKSHPLAKLEKRSSVELLRSNPFYSTM